MKDGRRHQPTGECGGGGLRGAGGGIHRLPVGCGPLSDRQVAPPHGGGTVRGGADEPPDGRLVRPTGRVLQCGYRKSGNRRIC